MRHWSPLRSMPLMPTLKWRHSCSHPQSKHIGGSLAGDADSPLSRRDEAEIFSIRSTSSHCHKFSSWLAVHVHMHDAPVCILMPVCAQQPSISSSDGISADTVVWFDGVCYSLVNETQVRRLVLKQCSRCCTQPVTQKSYIRKLGSLLWRRRNGKQTQCCRDGKVNYVWPWFFCIRVFSKYDCSVTGASYLRCFF